MLTDRRATGAGADRWQRPKTDGLAKFAVTLNQQRPDTPRHASPLSGKRTRNVVERTQKRGECGTDCRKAQAKWLLDVQWRMCKKLTCLQVSFHPEGVVSAADCVSNNETPRLNHKQRRKQDAGIQASSARTRI